MKFNLQELNKNQQFMKTNKETYLGISIGMFSLFLIFLITFVLINIYKGNSFIDTFSTPSSLIFIITLISLFSYSLISYYLAKKKA